MTQNEFLEFIYLVIEAFGPLTPLVIFTGLWILILVFERKPNAKLKPSQNARSSSFDTPDLDLAPFSPQAMMISKQKLKTANITSKTIPSKISTSIKQPPSSGSAKKSNTSKKR